MVLARGAAQTAKKAPAHTRRCKCDRQAGSSGSRSGPLLGSRHNTQGQPRRRSCRATPFLPSKKQQRARCTQVEIQALGGKEVAGEDQEVSSGTVAHQRKGPGRKGQVRSTRPRRRNGGQTNRRGPRRARSEASVKAACGFEGMGPSELKELVLVKVNRCRHQNRRARWPGQAQRCCRDTGAPTTEAAHQREAGPASAEWDRRPDSGRWGRTQWQTVFWKPSTGAIERDRRSLSLGEADLLVRLSPELRPSSPPWL